MAAAKEPDTGEQLTIGDAGAAEENLLTRRQVFGGIDPVEVADIEVEGTLFLCLVQGRQAGLDLAAQTAHGRRGEHSLGGTTNTHYRMHPGASHRGGDAGRQIAVANQSDTCSGGTDIGDQLLVTLPLEDDDGEVVDVAIEGVGDPAQVLRQQLPPRSQKVQHEHAGLHRRTLPLSDEHAGKTR